MKKRMTKHNVVRNAGALADESTSPSLSLH